MAKNGFGIKRIDEAFTYAIYKLLKNEEAEKSHRPNGWSAQDLSEYCVDGIHPMDYGLIDQYYGPLCAGPHDLDDLQMYRYAESLAKKGYFIMIEPPRPLGVPRNDEGYCQDDVKFKFNSDKVEELKHRSEKAPTTKKKVSFVRLMLILDLSFREQRRIQMRQNDP